MTRIVFAIAVLLCSLTFAHASTFALYLHDTEAAMLMAVLQRDDLTPPENVLASRVLPYGLQSWPDAPLVQPTCKQPFVKATVLPHRIVVKSPNVSISQLLTTLAGIQARTTDQTEAGKIAFLSLLIAQCGEASAKP